MEEDRENEGKERKKTKSREIGRMKAGGGKERKRR